MFSIGEISRRTGVKIPTIRYYEGMGLLSAPERTSGNQRRYGRAELQTLAFVKHARELGFSIEAILQLIELHHHPDQGCKAATDIAQDQLSAVRNKIEQLKALEGELNRIAQCCDGDTISGECHVLASLADHSLCAADH